MTGTNLRHRLGGAALALALLTGAPAATAVEYFPTDGEVLLEIRKGQLVRLDRPAAAVFVADPEVADVQAHSPTLVYVFGRRSGTTTLFAVDEGEEVLLSREIVVEHQLSGLQRILREIAPESRIEVRSVDGGIILEGAVRDATQAQELREAASRYLGENETLINRLSVTAPTQVNLRVQVAEVSREVTKILGFNWESVFSPGNFIFGLATGRDFLPEDGGARWLRGADQSGTLDAFNGTYDNGSIRIEGMIDALERNGLINMLAEPNLTALSGETASFLAGGEFPIPMDQDEDGITIEFKQFGVSLAFTPTVLNANRISMRVRPEVSDLSERGAIKLKDLEIPALATRRAETTVELGSGQSFAIGGLISNTTRNNLDKVPALGDLPVLGTLFRSTRFRRSESELVIIVTPYLVAPVGAAVMALPNDGLEDPSDLQRLIEGRLAVAGARRGGTATRPDRQPRLVGAAGFMLD